MCTLIIMYLHADIILCLANNFFFDCTCNVYVILSFFLSLQKWIDTF